jgi:SSS family solute:Na+ symporter
MSVQMVILVVYICMLLGISWYSTKLARAASNKTIGYLLAGRNMPWPILAVSICGLAVGGASTVGVAETAFTRGISAGWYNAAWGMGGIVVGLFFASHLRKMNVSTIPELMGKIFDTKTRAIADIIQLLVLITVTSLQYYAGGAILKVLLPNVFPTPQHGMLMSAVVFVLITLIGGYWASGLSNLISVAVIYIGIIITLVTTLSHFGGMNNVLADLPRTSEKGLSSSIALAPIAGVGIAYVCANIAVMVTQAVSMQAVSQISFAAKNSRTARTGITVGGILILPAGFLCAIFGIVAASRFPGIRPAEALPTIVMELSPAIGGIFLAALWAADVSTATSLLMGSSTLVIQDIVKKFVKVDPKHELVLSRVCVVTIGLIAFLLSLTVVGVLRTITTALATLCTFSIFIAANIYFPKVLRKAHGFWMVLVSLVLFVLWSYTPALNGIKPAMSGQLIYLEYIVNIVLFVVIAVCAKEPASIITVSKEE